MGCGPRCVRNPSLLMLGGFSSLAAWPVQPNGQKAWPWCGMVTVTEPCSATVGSGAMSQRRSRAGTGSPSASVSHQEEAGRIPSPAKRYPEVRASLQPASGTGPARPGTVIGHDREVPGSPRWPGGHRCFHPGRLRGHLRRVRRGTAAACRAAIWDAMAVEEFRGIVTAARVRQHRVREKAHHRLGCVSRGGSGR